MLPSGSNDAVPFSDTVADVTLIVVSLPAFATGATFGGGGAAPTLIITVSSSVAPLLSVTTNLNAYTPCTRSVTDVVALPALVMLYCAGPEIFVHAYAAMVPSASADALPFSNAMFAGSWID